MLICADFQLGKYRVYCTFQNFEKFEIDCNFKDTIAVVSWNFNIDIDF